MREAISVLTVISCIQVPTSDTAPLTQTLRKSRLVANTRPGDIGRTRVSGERRTCTIVLAARSAEPQEFLSVATILGG